MGSLHIERESFLPRLGALAAGLVIALAGIHFASAQDLPPEATNPPTRTVTSAPSTPKGEAEPIPPAASPQQAMTLSTEEQLLLSDTHDGAAKLDEPGFYVLLRHASALPLGEVTLQEADLVRPENLLQFPQRYRARLVRLEVRVWRITQWQEDLTNTRWWGRRPIWRLDCTAAADDKPEQIPLMVLLTRPPADLPEGTLPNGPRAAVAGLFYKTVHLRQERPTSQEAAGRDYPVVLANTLYAAAGGETEPPSKAPLALLAAMVGLLILGYLLARRFSSRRAKVQYGPLHQEFPEGSSGEEESAVDPELRRQVEEYRKNQGEGQT